MTHKERAQQARLGLMIFMRYGMDEYKRHVDNRPENKLAALENRVIELEKQLIEKPKP